LNEYLKTRTIQGVPLKGTLVARGTVLKNKGLNEPIVVHEEGELEEN